MKIATITRVHWWTEDNERDYYTAWTDEGHDHDGDVPTEVVDTPAWLAGRFAGATIREVDNNP